MERTETTTQRTKWKLMINFWVEQLLSLDFVKKTYSKAIPVMDATYMKNVLPISRTYQNFELPSSIFSTHVSFQAWAKSMSRTNWIIMKRNPPTRPMYIQATENLEKLIHSSRKGRCITALGANFELTMM